MSFLSDKKSEHEKACETAIQAGDAPAARLHAAKAAEFCFALAKQTTGPVAASYVKTAEGWLEIAEKLATAKLPRRSAPAAQTGNARPAANPPQADAGGENGGESFEVAEIPDVSFDDIAGMTQAKAAIREMVIYPMREPEKAKAMKLKPGGGVILYGPPGNGKTMFGKAIAHEIAAPFFYASGAQLRSKWHGESEQNLSRLLKTAASRPVAVLFLDEIDGLLPRRTANSSVVDNRIVTQFLSDVGGFRESDNILLILGATNKPWAIDEAVFRTGRFDEKLYIGLPDHEARLGMLDRSLEGVVCEPQIDRNAWADRLEGYTGSDIVGIVRKARLAAFRRSVESGSDPMVLAADLEDAVKVIPSSVTPAMIKQYDQFNQQRFGQ
ncbi:MAG: ATP-binding protein [Kiritimatiellae bacterium]|nr:ATP-binding protein [Kiritimatiellia bacterium]